MHIHVVSICCERLSMRLELLCQMRVSVKMFAIETQCSGTKEKGSAYGLLVSYWCLEQRVQKSHLYSLSLAIVDLNCSGKKSVRTKKRKFNSFVFT